LQLSILEEIIQKLEITRTEISYIGGVWLQELFGKKELFEGF